MTTFVARILVAFMTLSQIPLAGEVFAQSEGETQVIQEKTLIEELEEATKDELWYKSERISGRIEIGDFVVGPGRSEISAKPGETVRVEVTVTNRISDDREFMLEVEDIEGTRDGSSMQTLPSGEKSPTGLVDFISFPEDVLALSLGERARIPVDIRVPENTSPGGYFGAVLVSTIRKSTGGEGEIIPRSPIIARVASLIFLTVEGEVERSGEAKSLETINNYSNYGWWHESGPIEFGLLYENTGTVHLNPYGEISIRNILGDEVGFLQIEPWFVLPKSLRLREFSWDREFLFGRYTVEASVNRGYNDEVDVLTTSFWVLPWKLVGTVFLGLFIIIFLVRTFFRKFEFKRKD